MADDDDLNAHQLGTYRRRRITSTDVKIGGGSAELTKAQHLEPKIYDPGTYEVVVSLVKVGAHNYVDQDEGKTVVLEQMLHPKVVAVLPSTGSLAGELRIFLDDVAAKVAAAESEADGQRPLRAVS
jgi:hypothetical protein